MNKIAVYTCVTGGYDKIIKPAVINNEIDYLCFSDTYIDVPYPWKLIQIDEEEKFSGLDKKTINRKIKITPHVFHYFNNYELTIYIDGNIEILSDLSLLVETVKSQDEKIFMYDHFGRNCLYEEATECLLIGYDWQWNIYSQMRKYKRSGFPSHYGLFECSIIIRKNDPSINMLMDEWYKEYINGVKRDQLSLMYVAWSNMFEIKSLGRSDARFLKKNFNLVPHKASNSSLKRRIKAKLNKYMHSLAGGF